MYGQLSGIAIAAAVADGGRRSPRTTSELPPNIKLAARFWAIALPASTGEKIAGYDAHGKLIDQRSIWGLVRAMNLH
jgi:hypothetical protein